MQKIIFLMLQYRCFSIRFVLKLMIDYEKKKHILVSQMYIFRYLLHILVTFPEHEACQSTVSPVLLETIRMSKYVRQEGHSIWKALFLWVFICYISMFLVINPFGCSLCVGVPLAKFNTYNSVSVATV